MDETTATPPTPEPISEIQRLNELRLKVLAGEDIPPEQYHEVLIHVRKVRRAKGDPVDKAAKPKFDAAALLGGLGAPKP